MKKLKRLPGVKPPNRQAVLKNFPEADQEEIYLYAKGDGVEKRHTLKETLAWLISRKVTVSQTALSDFLKWWGKARRLRNAAHSALAYQRVLKNVPGLDLNEDQIALAGQALFEARALEKEDSELFIAMRQLKLEEREVQAKELKAKAYAEGLAQAMDCRNEELKFKKQQAKASNRRVKKAKVIDVEAETGDNSAAIAAMRLVAFAGVDALEASGEIVIPE